MTRMGARSTYLDHVFLKLQSKGIFNLSWGGLHQARFGWGGGFYRVGLRGLVYYLVYVCLMAI